MTSTRKIIRHTLRDLVVAAATAAQTRVETNRSSRVWKGRMPAVVIYTLDDPAEDFESAPKTYDATLRVAVECWTTKPDDEEHDDALDDLVEEIELALLPQIPALTDLVGGNRTKSGYEGVAAGFDANGERILAGARLTIRIHYPITPDYTPAAGLAPFQLARIEYDIAGGDDPDATDDVDLAQ